MYRIRTKLGNWVVFNKRGNIIKSGGPHWENPPEGLALSVRLRAMEICNA